MLSTFSSQYPIVQKPFHKALIYLGLSFLFQLIVIVLQKLQPHNLGGNLVSSTVSFLLLLFSIGYFLKNTNPEYPNEKNRYIEVQEFSRKLGNFTKTFEIRENLLIKHFFVIGWSFFILGSLVTIASSFILAYSTNGKYFLMGSWILLFVGSILLLYYYIQKNYKIVLFENGMIIKKLSGLNLIKFEDINCINQRISKRYLNGIKRVYNEVDFDYTVTIKNGTIVSFTKSITDVKELGDQISRGVFRVSIQKYQKLFLSGQILNFVELSISTDGIWVNQTLYKWEEVDDIKVSDGYLYIKLINDAKLKFDIQKIPNFLVLYEFLPTWHDYKRLYL